MEPLTLEEAKQHLLISPNDTNHDTFVTALIEASRQEFEHDTQALTVQRSVQEESATWFDPHWTFYFRPVVLVNSITYFDDNNQTRTLDPSVYSVDYPNRRIYLAPDQEWPTLYDRWDAVKVDYDAGYLVDDVPETAKAAIKLKLNVLFELRGLAPNQTTEHSDKAYEMLVAKYSRSNYP